TEQDWWQGGYEASGALWGPRQGDYLAARTIEGVETFWDGYRDPPFEEPPVLAPFSGYSYSPYQPERAIDAGTIVEDVVAAPASTDVVRFTVLGSDPWLGTPVAVLERQTASGFEPVLRTNGTPIDSDGYEMWVDLAVSPSY